jgi:hypothetical protein
MKTIKAKIFRILLKTYRILFLKNSFFKINKMLFSLSLIGMGILNYENDQVSGEDFLLKKLAKLCECPNFNLCSRY